MPIINNFEIEKECQIIQVLGHPIRLKVLLWLSHNTGCAQKIGDVLGLTASQIAPHIALLKIKKIIEAIPDTKKNFKIINPIVLEYLHLIENHYEKKEK